MEKSQINFDTGYYENYIQQVPQENIIEALDFSLKALETEDLSDLIKLRDQVYLPGKWTIKDIFQHIIDTERIMAYRALRFARKDATELPGFDENFYADQTNTRNRTLDELMEELLLVRKSTRMLFKSFDPENINNKGICSHKTLTPLALGFIIIGHEIHHRGIIRERYIPLL